MSSRKNELKLTYGNVEFQKFPLVKPRIPLQQAGVEGCRRQGPRGGKGRASVQQNREGEGRDEN
jgi:hypothetical protein